MFCNENLILTFLYVCSCRLATLVVTAVLLNTVHYSPLLAVCGLMTGAAAYIQITQVSITYYTF